MRIAAHSLLVTAAAAIVIAAGCTSEATELDRDLEATGTTIEPLARASGPLVARPASFAATAAPSAAASIGYHGGPVMLGTPDIYFIWYGNWSGSTAPTVIPDFMSHLGGSPYLAINTTYADAQGHAVSGNVHYAGATTDAYSRGTSLTDQDIELVVSSALSSGALPTSTNAVYFVLTSADVSMAGFCNGFCGWHTNGSSVLGSHIKYSFIGDPTRCPKSCAPYSPSPNGDAAVDGMASILAHELEETLTDPELNGWIDSGSQENGDKCAWKFGTTYTTPSGAKANMRLGNRDYLIQTNFDRQTNQCELALPAQSSLTVTVLSPASSSVLHAGGPLDIVAQVTDNATVTSAVAHWTAFGSTSDFTLTKNAAGNWELATTMSTAARVGSRSFTVTATDNTGHQVTSSPRLLQLN